MKDGIQIKKREINSAGNSENSKMKGSVRAAIIAGVVVAVLAAGTAAFGIYVNKLETIYPNVTVSGTDVAGKTLDEAKLALIDAGYEKTSNNVSVIVNFPDKVQMSINGEDSGVKIQASDAATLAFDFGRSGSFLEKELTYIKCLFNKNEVDHSGTTYINETYVKGIIDEHVKAFNLKIMKDTFKIETDKLTITKGSNSAMADPDALYKLVVSSLDESVSKGAPVTVQYDVGTSGGTDIDLQKIYDTVHVEPVSAVYDAEKKQVTPSTVGMSFDIEAAKKTIDNAQTGATIAIPLVITQPEMTTEQLQGTLFQDVLAERKTSVSGTSNRINNVKLATQAVNGFILNPGETFSYNKTLGQRTAEKGYKEAGAYSSGKVIQEIGGGICQVSSTLYCTTLYADLDIVERSNHMFIVTYLPLGMDATVNWGTVDFKFKNTTKYPIKIEAIMNKGTLSVRLLGTKTNTNRVEVNYVVISTKDFKTVYEEDASIAKDTTKVEAKGEKGYVVETYKSIFDANNNLLSKTFIARSSYRTEDKVVLVPVGSPLAHPAIAEQPAASPSSALPEVSQTPDPTTPSATPSTAPSAESTPIHSPGA